MAATVSKKRKRGNHSPSKNTMHGAELAKRRKMTGIVKPQGLRRPKAPISYSVPPRMQLLVNSDNQNLSRSPTPNSTTKESPIVALSRIKILLDLVYRRNKNQHRNQPFWKWLSLLRRSVIRLIAVHQQVLDIGSNSSKSTSGTLKADDIRRKFEQQADLRSQREYHEEWIRETIVPQSYVTFSCLVHDLQFANLGVALMGVLSDVVDMVGPCKTIERLPKAVATRQLRPEKESRTKEDGKIKTGKSLVGVSTLMTGPDQGEVVERTYDSETAFSGGGADDNGESDAGVLTPRDFKQDRHDKKPERETLDENWTGLEEETPQSTTTTSTSVNAPTSQPSRSTDQIPNPRSTPPLKPSTSKSKSEPIQTSHSTNQHLAETSTLPASTLQPSTSRQNPENSTPEPRKKKKKKGNAIDDLFGGLL